MGKFFALVSVENTKLWKRLSAKIMVGILIAIVFGMCALIKAETAAIQASQTSSGSTQTSSASSQTSGDWKASLEAQDQSLQQTISEAEKNSDLSAKDSLDQTKRQLAVNQYYLDHNIRPATYTDSSTDSTVSKEPFWESTMSVGTVSWAALFVIIACTALVAGEFSEGTMKTMLPRPFTRWQILTAKLLASMGYAIVLIVVGTLTAMAGTAIFTGTTGAGDPVLLWIGGHIVAAPGGAALLLSTFLDLLSLFVYLFLTFMLAVVTRSRAFATGLSIFLMFGGNAAILLAMRFSWGKLVFFADTNFSSFITSGAPFYGITLGLALLICGVYSAAFLAVGYVTFQKRDVA